jgi:hypothetical protein
MEVRRRAPQAVGGACRGELLHDDEAKSFDSFVSAAAWQTIKF